MTDEDLEGFESLFTTCAEDGISTASVADGQVFMISVPVLERLLELAKTDPNGRAVVFVKRPRAAGEGN